MRHGRAALVPTHRTPHHDRSGRDARPSPTETREPPDARTPRRLCPPRREAGDHCCHSNLTRALADATGLAIPAAEGHVHDALNVFMCTGFTRDTGQYFMKASPVRPGDYLECFAEIALLGALSACPGGDCSSEHSSDQAACHPLKVEVFETPAEALAGWTGPALNGYAGGHGR